MGYDLHITKKQNWFEEGVDISESEWLDYVSSDPEFQMTGNAKAPFPDGSALVYENPFLAEWNGHSSKRPIWFDFRNGQIIVKNPDKEIIEKMKSIALKVKGRVQGDEGEFYE